MSVLNHPATQLWLEHTRLADKNNVKLHTRPFGNRDEFLKYQEMKRARTASHFGYSSSLHCLQEIYVKSECYCSRCGRKFTAKRYPKKLVKSVWLKNGLKYSVYVCEKDCKEVA